MNLIIVESPTKARTLSRFLGKEYVIESTMGHVRDLPKDKLGVDTEHDFEPKYIPVKERREKVAQLKKLSSSADRVILATDPDREGEAIAWHVSQLIAAKSKVKSQKSKVERITFHEITENAIEQSLDHPRGIDMPLVDAQQARRILDRLVGYKLSPLLWYKVRKGLSAGRVQSVALRLIVEREREIEAFVPVEYWLVDAELSKNSPPYQGGVPEGQGGLFTARLIEKEGKKIEVKKKEEADIIVSDLQHASYAVTDVKKKELKRSPYPPFTTSTMQQAGANRFGWSAKKTMQMAQRLYEEGYITYHRTDSTNLAAEAVDKARSFIEHTFGIPYLPDAPKLYKTKSKVAQEAHEAIRPTHIERVAPKEMELTPLQHAQVQVLLEDLGRDLQMLYSLIWKRFVACQMREAIYDQTAVDIKAGLYLLRANGSVVKFDGWMVVNQRTEDRGRKTENGGQRTENDDLGTLGDLGDLRTSEEQRALPELSIEEKLNLERLLPQQKFTEPPPRFNEASIIKALEERGIGRPSTYAPIISTILERQYVEKIERRLHATPLGKAVNDFLVTNFPDIVDYDFTARMEDKLDAIANGEIQWVPTIREFYTPFNEKIASVYKGAERVKIETEAIDEMCPKCSKSLVVRIGKFGKFVACSTYPTCDFTKQYIEKAGMPCPKCGGDARLPSPPARYASVAGGGGEATGGQVILRKTKRGKQFYGCSSYPKCDFASWTKPKAAS